MKYLATVFLFASILIFSACDEISSGFEKKATTGPVDTSGYGQKVLLEEFTGHECRNCPIGHKVSAQLRDLYGENLITVAVHAGGFADIDKDYPQDFRTTSGTELNKLFNVNSYPAGVLNRTMANGQYVQSSAAWATQVDALVKQKAKFKMHLTPTYNATTSEVSLAVTVQNKDLVTTTKPVNIALYVVEDSIIAPQLNLSTRIPDYLHRDVLRDAPLGTYGSPLSSSATIAAQSKIEKTFVVSFAGKTWNVAHCKIVAVICQQDPDYTVMQVEEVKVQP